MYNSFKKLLGEYDAVSEFIELMVRDFKYRYEDYIMDSKFLENKSKEHNIFITSYDYNIFSNKITTNYIVSVNQCFESFLKDVNTNGKKIGKYTWNSRREDESWLNCIVNNVLTLEERKSTQPIIELCEYYRLVRNHSVHSISKKDECEKNFKLLQKNIEFIKNRYSKLNAPNEINKIEFDDFIIFSRATKDIAKCIYESFKYDPDKIYNAHDWDKLKSYKNNPDRLKKIVEQKLKVSYNMDKETLDDIVNKVYNYII